MSHTTYTARHDQAAHRIASASRRDRWADPADDVAADLNAEQEAEIDELRSVLEPHTDALELGLDFEIDETWGYAVAYIVDGDHRWAVEVDERQAARALAAVVAGPGLADPVLHSIIESICTGAATVSGVRAFMDGVVARKRNEPIECYRPVCEWSQAGWDETDEALAAR